MNYLLHPDCSHQYPGNHFLFSLKNIVRSQSYPHDVDKSVIHVMWITFRHIFQGWSEMVHVVLWFGMGEFYPYPSWLLHWYLSNQGPDSIYRWRLTSIGNPVVVIRQFCYHSISTMGFPRLVRWYLYTESGPRWRIVHMVSTLLMSDVFGTRFYPYPSGLLHWHCEKTWWI